MLRIHTIQVTPFMQNCRIVWCDSTFEAAIIDPGGEASRIWSFVQEGKLSCSQIWLTHSHLDHCGGVASLMRSATCELWAHSSERFFRENLEAICLQYGMPRGDMENCPEPGHELVDCAELSVGNERLEILFTPGHSPGHFSFYHSETKTLFAGDTLFQGSIGRTDLPGGDHELLLKSIRERIFTLGDDTKVLPGHGPDTNVGQERVSNPFLS